ncbi:MAG: RNA-binding protein [Candidatus Thorarchaeota archaeon]|nr:MAG: RNA-binding protein [Candidatus Thorarchaeota archaeon]
MTREVDPTKIAITWQEPAMLQVGKSGLTEGLVKETLRLLKKHRYIKVRMLRSSLEEDSKASIIEELVTKCSATLAGIRGNTAVIYRLR